MFDIFNTRIAKKRLAMVCSAVFSVLKALLIIFSFTHLASALVSIWESCGIDSQAYSNITIFAIFFACRFVIIAIESVIYDKYSQFVRKSYLLAYANKLYDEDVSVIKSQGTPSFVVDCIRGLDDVQNYIKSAIPKTTDLLIIPLCLLVAIFSFDVMSGLISLMCFPVIIFFMRLIGQNAGEMSKRKYGEFLLLSNSFTDVLTGIDEIKNCNAIFNYSDVVFKRSEKLKLETMKTLKIAFLSTALLDIIATLSICAAAIMLGFRLVDTSLNFYNALFCLLLLPEYYLPIRRFAEDYHLTLNGKTALDKISMFLASKSNEIKSIFLDEFTIHIKDFGLVGIKGESGSGKTTLLNKIFADGIGRFDRCRIGYVCQNPHIFKASLLENICFYNPDACSAEVKKVIDLLGLNELVSQLDGGLNGLVGDGKRSLSGGEIKRIALARLFLDPSKSVWILDEPFAGIDDGLCKLIKLFLEVESRKRLIFVSTHDDLWVDSFNSAINLESGHIISARGVRVEYA